MIIDRIENDHYYYRLHPAFWEAFAFLKKPDIAHYSDGSYEIEGNRLYATISSRNAKTKTHAKLEIHKHYIDIQMCLHGADCIGWKPLTECLYEEGPFDAKKDCGFFTDAPESWILLPHSTFAIFFPHDAHAPLAGKGYLRKVVVKIAVKW